MTIYRVENPDNTCGPYAMDQLYGTIGYEIVQMMYDEHNDSSTHPVKSMDYLPTMMTSIYECQCAFDSFDKLISWFDKWIDYLLNMGFQIIEAQVPDTQIYYSISGKQIFFKRDNIVITNVIS